MLVDITTTSLEMNDQSEFKPSSREIPNLEIKRAEIALPELNRFLYTAVGGLLLDRSAAVDVLPMGNLAQPSRTRDLAGVPQRHGGGLF